MPVKLQQKHEKRHRNHAAAGSLDDFQSVLFEPISCVLADSAALELVRLGGSDRKPAREMTREERADLAMGISRHDLARMEPRASDHLVNRRLVDRSCPYFTSAIEHHSGFSETTDCIGNLSHFRNDLGCCSFL
jgi:hypothetical protein